MGMGCCYHLIRYSVGLLAFTTWLMGSIIIAYVLWMLSTSTSTLKALFEGTTPVTYVAIGAGSLLFTNGLLGWMGSSNKRGSCMLKLFLVLGILTIAAEIGGIITLSILRVKVTDIVDQAWKETNLKTHHLLQEQFECCGLTGPSEYAKTAEVIDISCYHRMKPSDMSKEELESFNNSTSRVNGEQDDLRVLHKVGCKQQLLDWFFKHMLLWVAGFGCFLFFQALCFCLTVSALSFKDRSLDSMDRLHSHTYM